MTARWPVLTDDVLRAVLTESPAAGLTDVVLDELMVMIDQTPQRRRARMHWPWSPALPTVLSANKRGRRLDAAAALVVLVLVLGAAVAAIVVVGSVSRVRPLGSSGLIAFAAGGEIWVANPDGSGPRQVTNDGQRDGQPTFSPDGRRIAYQSIDTATSTISLVVTDLDGTRRVVVATSPADSRYTNVVRSTSDGSTGVDATPWYLVAWSPDGSRIAYETPMGGAQQLFVVDSGGGDPRPVGDPALQGHFPVWSPDGTRIAFVGGHFDDDRGVYLMGADGTAPRRLGPMPGKWASEFGIPAWSPDGESLAFSARIDSRFRVFVDALDGTAPRAVSGDGEQDNVNAAWSPDGHRLAWITHSATDESWRFVVAATDGSGPSVLSPTVNGGPVWSPDGTSLLGYRADASGRLDRLVLIRVADGSMSEVQAQPDDGDASWQWLSR